MHCLTAVACALALASAGVVSVPQAPTSASQVNPYLGKDVYANRGYAKKLDATIQYFNKNFDFVNAAKTRTVQRIPTFAWVSDTAGISSVKGLISETLLAQTITRKKQILQLVVYNLPDPIGKELSTTDAKKINFVVILEPDSLGNIITNLSIEKCAKAAPAYKEGVSMAWMEDNLAPTAALFADVLKGAQNVTSGATVRGVSINVSNYNQYVSLVRENFTKWSHSWDESHYADSLSPYLESAGFPAKFIVDQGRAGKGAIRTEWGQWCNIRNAGFGTRPTTDQAVLNNPLVDSIVWDKPGGESDGTSDASAVRFDATCAGPIAHFPAPEAGTWFNDYVVNLVKEASPTLQLSWF